ncbi:MAG: FAD-dependent oxidoreductase [Gammaproteobacteria bacterium]|nr:FAD-dependent oxidoreductase [Gammaproteobacteria bacterium]MBU1442652.1 FAD-dependent oxidoreductase [Gammaproteobacteria bacterium]MBU2288698.1 FAD-dependent oxidoreductase [Gammaproteobacteria bacterium]MBU2409484.1 FAD-dependent oxidoreductase [Gammaproteobacteria bacterium]
MKRRAFIGAAAGTTFLAGCDVAPPIDGGFVGVNVERGHAFRDRQWAAQSAPLPTRRTRVVIAGGGVAGLAAARALRLAGVDDFVLLELEDSAGGNSRGGQVRGITCPLGAHYLPVPGDEAREVQDLLEELGLRRRVAGRWEYDERHLCHSPQERLFFRGEWQDGLLPIHGVAESTLAQYRSFSARMAALAREAPFTIPVLRAPLSPALLALDAISFETWLDQQALDDPQLRWYLDYCCRDDYGAGLGQVSARAGIHYFASRHGFHAPGEDPGERDSVLTWPEGNAWLTRRLAAPLGERLKTGHVVTRISESRGGVEVDAYDVASHTFVRWQAERCIVALPVFVAVRAVESPGKALRVAASASSHAPWLVANAHLRAPLASSPGVPLSWDNVIYGTAGLGYVDARHQSLDPTPGPTVLSWYRPLGASGHDGPDGRRQLMDASWASWRDALLGELSVPHPDIAALISRIDITRHGHAMAVPTPGLLARIGAPELVVDGRLVYAHADWSGYSIFEEAFIRGHLAGEHSAR